MKLKKDVSNFVDAYTSQLEALDFHEYDFSLCEVDDYLMPYQLYSQLHEFQKVGVQWMLNNLSNDRGSILADEMGLGKTIQLISVISAIIESTLRFVDPHDNSNVQSLHETCEQFYKSTTADLLTEQFGNNDELSCKTVRRRGFNDIIDKSSATLSLMKLAKVNDLTEDMRSIQEHNNRFSALKSLSLAILSQFKFTVVMIAPATVVAQLFAEFRRFAPLIPVSIHCASYLRTGGRLNPGVNFACYESIRVSYDAMKKHSIDLLILDEGHRIRNSSTGITVAIKSLHATNRILLSGTPIQNNLSELWSIVDFVCPSLLGTLPTFQQHFAEPLERGLLKSASPAFRSFAISASKLLKSILLPHILRRTRKSVNILQDISINQYVCFVPLTQFQYKLYVYYLKTFAVRIKQSIAALKSTTLTKISDTEASQRPNASSLKDMSILSVICNHPDILLTSAPHEYRRYLTKLTFGSRSRSSKLNSVLTLISRLIKCNYKIVLFSQRLMILDILEANLQNYKLLRLDGSISCTKRRADIIKQFNTSDTNLILVSIKVGGIGLNLTSANVVILFDPDWNPANDEQALSRCLRLGQNQNVKVFRIISDTPFENYIYETQLNKIGLTQLFYENKSDRKGTHKELSAMFMAPKPPSYEEYEVIDHELLRMYYKAIHNRAYGLSTNKLYSNISEITISEGFEGDGFLEPNSSGADDINLSDLFSIVKHTSKNKKIDDRSYETKVDDDDDERGASKRSEKAKSTVITRILDEVEDFSNRKHDTFKEAFEKAAVELEHNKSQLNQLIQEHAKNVTKKQPAKSAQKK